MKADQKEEKEINTGEDSGEEDMAVATVAGTAVVAPQEASVVLVEEVLAAVAPVVVGKKKAELTGLNKILVRYCSHIFNNHCGGSTSTITYAGTTNFPLVLLKHMDQCNNNTRT